MNTYGLTFERFRALNAYPFERVDLNLRNRGLVRMAGPNGAGKSSVWNLFTQACQGSSPNSAKKSDLQFTDKDFLLEVTFQKHGSTYVAATATKCKEVSPTGSPYGTGVYLYRDGQDISMHKDPDTVKLIRSTLGWSLEEWYGYVLLVQSTTHTLINGTRSERQNYLSALFNLTPLDALAKHFKEKSEVLVEKLEALEVKKQTLAIKTQMLGTVSLEDLVQQQTDLRNEVKSIDALLLQYKEDQKQYEALKVATEDLIKAKATVPEGIGTSVELESKIQQLKSLQAAYDANESLRNKLQLDLQNLKQPLDVALPEGWKPEYADSSDIDLSREQGELRRLTQLANTLVEVPTVQIPLDFTEVLGSPDINLASVERQIKEIEARPAPPTFVRPTEEQITTLIELKSSISYTILNLQGDIKRLELNESVCPTCGTNLDCQDRAGQLTAKMSELETFQEELLISQTKLDQKVKQNKAWLDYDALGPDRSGELPELKASVDLYMKKKQYLTLRSQQDSRMAYEKAFAEIQGISELELKIKIYNLKKQYQAYEKNSTLVQDYEKSRKLIADSIASLPQLTNVQADLRAAEINKGRVDQLEAKQALVNSLEASGASSMDRTEKIKLIGEERDSTLAAISKLNTEEARVRELSLQISSLQKEISSMDTMVRDQKKYALLAKGYGKAGALRELQLSKFSRYLEEALWSYTIKQLPDHRFQFRVDDGIDILAEYVGKEKPKTEPYDVKFMSGGEKGALSVAFLFALDDLLPPHRRTNLKILDEVEGAFDSSKQQDFIHHTLPELRKRAETVVVISHSHASNEGAFDRVWEIKNGCVVDQTKDAREFSEA